MSQISENTTATSPAVPEFAFLTNHGKTLLLIAQDPRIRLRDIAGLLGITERATHRIVAELDRAGYVDRERDGPQCRRGADRSAALAARARGAGGRGRGAARELSGARRRPESGRRSRTRGGGVSSAEQRRDSTPPASCGCRAQSPRGARRVAELRHAAEARADRSRSGRPWGRRARARVE